MKDYKQILENKIWSFSSLQTYNQCPYEFYLKYLLRDENGEPIYNAVENFYGVYGKFCHGLLEQIFQHKISLDEAYELYQTEYDQTIAGFNVKDTTIDKYFYQGLSYFSSLTNDMISDYKILGVEKKVDFMIEGYKFVGYIDLLLQNLSTGDILVIDHKSSEFPLGKRGHVKKAKQKSYNAYKRQLYLYSKAIYEEYHQYPKMLVWNYFKEGEILKLPFEYDEYIAALEWGVNTIHEIEKDVEYQEHFDHFYCTQLCGYRLGTRTCEYADRYF